MISTLRALWVWVAVLSLIFVWVPLLSAIRLLDRDPVRRRTGFWFRRLGKAAVKANPAWRVHVSGMENFRPNQPCVVVSDHQSMVDIPVICFLPWEMKWMAKTELFRTPIVGWMMRMAGDIPVDRSQRGGAPALLQARKYLQQGCSVMVFPEGTRSRDGLVHPFTDGAFHLAIRARVPILPLAIDGTYACLEKGSWKFGKPSDIQLKVLPPVDTADLSTRDLALVRDRVRTMIIEQIAQWRGVAPGDVDAAGPTAEPDSLVSEGTPSGRATLHDQSSF